jgi:photosystem II stability/assembly factor-like uncharacterized protein
MRVIKYTFKHILRSVNQAMCSLFTCTALLLLCYPAFAVVDALEDSAPRTERAVKGLLLDIVQVEKRLISLGERGHIFYSDDQGNSWQQANVPVRVTLTAITFSTATHGWAVGHDGVILTTRDGGVNWLKQLDGYQANQLIENELKRLLALSEEQRTAQNIGYSVEQLNYLLEDAELFTDEGASRPFLEVFFVDEQIGLAVGAYGMIFRTEDSGENWRPLVANLSNPDNFHLNTLINSRDTLYIAGEAGSLYRSDDKGLSWMILPSPYDGPFFGMSVSYTATGTEGLVVYGLRGNAFISTNQGQKWSRLNVGSDTSILGSVAMVASEFILLSGGGELFRFNIDGQLLGRSLTPDRSALSSGLISTANELLLVGVNGMTHLNLPKIQWEAP